MRARWGALAFAGDDSFCLVRCGAGPTRFLLREKRPPRKGEMTLGLLTGLRDQLSSIEMMRVISSVLKPIAAAFFTPGKTATS